MEHTKSSEIECVCVCVFCSFLFSFFVFLVLTTFHLQGSHNNCLFVFFVFSTFQLQESDFLCFAASLVPKVLNIVSLLAFFFSAFPTFQRFGIQISENKRC